MSEKSFEEYYVGWKRRHSLGRTIIETDEVWLCNLVTSPNQLHFNKDYASRTQFGQSAVNAPVTNAMVVGLTTDEFGQNCRIKRWSYIRMPKPLFVGETVYAESEVLALDAGQAQDPFGTLTVRTCGVTETGKIVIDMEREIYVRKAAFPEMTLYEKETEERRAGK